MSDLIDAVEAKQEDRIFRYAAIYAQCLQAASFVVMGAVFSPTPKPRVFSQKDIENQADSWFARCIAVAADAAG